MDEAKPFKIPKREVWEAFKRVKRHATMGAKCQKPTHQLLTRSPRRRGRMTLGRWRPRDGLCTGRVFGAPRV